MNHKVGDRVQIRSKEWIDNQKKDDDGDIRGGFVREMFKYAGKVATIVALDIDAFSLDIDDGDYCWTEEMFDPDYDPLAPLSAEDAIRAMLEGEVLQKIAYKVEEKWDGKHFVYRVLGEEKWTNKPQGGEFEGLGRKRKVRPWTRWEILAWANSDESRGWVVKHRDADNWISPQCSSYNDETYKYQRARMLPDHSGIDESTIQGFVVEVEAEDGKVV
jgi:hypothetical protein